MFVISIKTIQLLAHYFYDLSLIIFKFKHVFCSFTISLVVAQVYNTGTEIMHGIAKFLLAPVAMQELKAARSHAPTSIIF
jgi:hypothetical protein